MKHLKTWVVYVVSILIITLTTFTATIIEVANKRMIVFGNVKSWVSNHQHLASIIAAIAAIIAVLVVLGTIALGTFKLLQKKNISTVLAAYAVCLVLPLLAALVIPFVLQGYLYGVSLILSGTVLLLCTAIVLSSWYYWCYMAVVFWFERKQKRKEEKKE